MNPEVEAFFDEATNTISYVVSDRDSGQCAVIDPVLDYDPASGRTSTGSAESIVDHVQSRDLDLAWILETHVHADHMTAAPYIKDRMGGQIAIGSGIKEVLAAFIPVFNIDDVPADGSQFDRLLDEGDELPLGKLAVRVLSTPGHTPACSTYVIGDAAFVGDTVFMPDFGTARCDFPGGDAETLYESIQKIFALPPETRLYMCHDYKAPGRDEYAWESSVAEQREKNVNINDGVSRADFVSYRSNRDAQLGMPKLVLPALQVNMRAGRFPPAEQNGVSYLKIPLDKL